MASNKINNLYFSTITRVAPKNGPSSSDVWNDTINELVTDISLLSNEWSDKLVPIFDALPSGVEDTSIDAYKTGIEGKTLWANKDATSVESLFYSSSKSRPYTIYEVLGNLYTYIDVQLESLSTTLAETSSALTTDQKNKIGANIFNTLSASSATSLDGKSERNRLNIIQLANDLYGAGYTLANTGTAQLTNSVFAMVDALLELHNGNWSDNIAVNHLGAITGLTQEDISSSHPGNDSYVPELSPSTTLNDLNFIRTVIKTLKGTGTWTTALTALYSGGADSLSDLLTSTNGSGTKTSTNPWGYRYDNIDGLVSILDAIKTFIGQSSYTDSTPLYSGLNYVVNGDSLETSIGKLDIQVHANTTNLATISGYTTAVKTFTGQDLSTDTTPDYSTTYNISNGDSLETAIGKLDAVLNTQSGVVTNLNHHSLVGLLDDDHTQYALIDGSRHFSSGITASGQIISTTTVSGLNVSSTQDINIVSSGYGLILQSANGTRWRITVDDSGALTTTAV